jgi:hypothetical protein
MFHSPLEDVTSFAQKCQLAFVIQLKEGFAITLLPSTRRIQVDITGYQGEMYPQHKSKEYLTIHRGEKASDVSKVD